MGAIVGFVAGYVLGTRSGEDGWNELLEAWRTITSSDEVADLLAGGLAMARDLVRQGAGMMAERLSGDEAPTLRLQQG